MAVLVGEENHDWKTANDDTLEDEENGSEDNVERHDTGRTVHTIITAFSTGQALECIIMVI